MRLSFSRERECTVRALRPLPLHGLAKAGEHEGEEGEAAAGVFAGDPTGDGEQGRGFCLFCVLGGGGANSFGDAVEGFGVEGREDLEERDQVADAGDAFGQHGVLREFAGNRVLRADHSVEQVKDALVVGGLEEIPGDEEGFGVLGGRGSELALRFGARVDGKRLEGSGFAMTCYLGVGLPGRVVWSRGASGGAVMARYGLVQALPCVDLGCCRKQRKAYPSEVADEDRRLLCRGPRLSRRAASR